MVHVHTGIKLLMISHSFTYSFCFYSYSHIYPSKRNAKSKICHFFSLRLCFVYIILRLCHRLSTTSNLLFLEVKTVIKKIIFKPEVGQFAKSQKISSL